MRQFVFLLLSGLLSLPALHAQDNCTAPYTPVWDDYSTCGNMYLQGIGLDSLTASGTTPAPICGSHTPGTTTDAWVRFVVPAGLNTLYLHAFNSDIGIDLSAFPGGGIFPATCNGYPHLAMSVYRGSDCNNLTEISCIEADPPQCLTLPFFGAQLTEASEIRFEPLTGLIPGETIWVRLWDINGTGNNFFFAASENNSLPEDDCDTPQPLTGVGACNILSTGGDMQPPEECGWNSTDNSTFYTFTVDPSDPQPFTIDAQNTACYGNPGGTFNFLDFEIPVSDVEIQIAVYSYNGNGCNDLGGGPTTTPVGANYEGCANGTGSVTFSENLPPGNYVLAIDGFSGSTGTSLCTYGINLPDPPFPQFEPDTVCAGVPVAFIDQSTNNPTSWDWTFTGATPSSSTQQDPTVTFANAGTFQVTLVATNQYGSSAPLTKDIVVLANEPTSFTPIGPFCDGDPAVSLSATPAGGTFNGQGVSGSNFDPALAGVGTHTLTYSGTGACGPYSTDITVVVDPDPAASIDPVSDLCPGDPAVTLSGTPAGGTFSGTGVSGNQFDPTGLAPGTYTITYDGTGSCGTYSVQTDVTILPPPTATIDPVADLCDDATAVTLSATPAGGTFSGPGVSGGQFDPSVAGVGTHTVTYDGSTNCGAYTTTIDIVVIAAPVLDFAPAPEYCVGDPAVTLTATPGGGSFSGPGVSGTSFDPSTAGLGTHTLTYTFTNSCGTYSVDTSVSVVNTQPSSIDPVAVQCENGPAITLTASPAGGTFSGPGITGNQFDPSGLAAGVYSIDYDGTGNCGAFSASLDIEVVAAPVLDFSLSATPCDSDAPITLSATPTGGTFSGPGVTGNSFDPAAAGAGTHTLTYTLTHPCGTFDATASIEVLPTPVLSINSIQPLCENGSPVTLSASPAGGTFSGPGVNGTDFEPSTVGAGSYTITYSFTGSCGLQTETADIEVEAVPSPSINPPSSPICEGDNAVTLSATPAGGTFSGPGMNGAAFDPASLAAGSYTVTYSLTNACGTFDTDLQLDVQPTPVVDVGPDQTVCGLTSDLSASASGDPDASGSWVATSVPSGVSSTPVYANQNALTTSVTVPEAGVYAFRYSEDLNGCTGSDVVEVEFITLEEIQTAPYAFDCDNSTITASVLPEPGVTYTWYDAAPPAGNVLGTGTSIDFAGSQAAFNQVWVLPTQGDCEGQPVMFNAQLPTPAPPIASAEPVCLEDEAVFTVSAPEPVASAAYSWQLTPDGPEVATGEAFALLATDDPTRVYLTRDSAGCISEMAEASFSPVARPEADFILSDSVIGTGERVTLTEQAFNADTYLWTLGDGTTSTRPVFEHAYSLPDTYLVSLRAANGLCADSVSKQIVVEGWRLEIPTAFSPNGDGLNDAYAPIAQGLEELRFQIYNRWGTQVGSFTEGESWDGQAENGACPEGVYVITVQARRPSGEPIEESRTITLLR